MTLPNPNKIRHEIRQALLVAAAWTIFGALAGAGILCMAGVLGGCKGNLVTSPGTTGTSSGSGTSGTTSGTTAAPATSSTTADSGSGGGGSSGSSAESSSGGPDVGPSCLPADVTCTGQPVPCCEGLACACHTADGSTCC